MSTVRNNHIAVIIANQSWVSIDNQTDYALLDLNADGECWARKLIRKIKGWQFFDRIIVLYEDEVTQATYSKICSDQGVDFQLVPAGLYKWPRIWYPWAWNFQAKGIPEIILAWVHWLQMSLNPATYFVLNISDGFIRKEHLSRALLSYKKGHRAALQNEFGRCGYIVDSIYLNTVYSSNYERMALLADFEDYQHLEQIIIDHGSRIAAFQSRMKIPMGLWNRRYFNLIQNYCKRHPEEVQTLELNSKMFSFLESNYFLHQSEWLNFLEIRFIASQSEWLSYEHLAEVSRQAENYGRVTFVLDFNHVNSTDGILHLLNAISQNLFLAVKIPAQSPVSLIKSLLTRVDYLELSLARNIDYLNCVNFENQLFYQNWIFAYEESLRNQKPCFGLSINIPEDPRQSIAMLDYFKDRLDFNPCMHSERIQGDGYPRTPNLNFQSHLSFGIEESVKSNLGGLFLNHQGQGVQSKTVYELSIEKQLKSSISDSS